jgi:hypothetical protein
MRIHFLGILDFLCSLSLSWSYVNTSKRKARPPPRFFSLHNFSPSSMRLRRTLGMRGPSLNRFVIPYADPSSLSGAAKPRYLRGQGKERALLINNQGTTPFTKTKAPGTTHQVLLYALGRV